MTAAYPESPRLDRAVLLLWMLGYVGLFLAYYPPISGIEDEAGFVNQALVWSRGAISSEGAGLQDLFDFGLINGRHVAQRHPGRSLVAPPFLLVGGVRAVFLSGLVLHLALTWFAATLLTRLGRSPLGAVLLLFHPTLAIYSRTVMADAAAGTGLLLAALALLSASPRAGIWAGLAVGLAASMRYHAAAALPFVAIAFHTLPERPHPWRDLVHCLLAGAGAGGLIVAYNLAVYGTAMDPFSAARGVFSVAYFVPNATFYAKALAVIWPLMLLAPLLDDSPLRWLTRSVCAFFFFFLSLYYFHDKTSRLLETLVVGQRLLQVALPLWIVSYAWVLSRWLAAPLRRWLGGPASAVFVAVACAGLFSSTAIMFSKHQAHLNRLRAIRDTVVSKIPAESLVICEGVVLKVLAIPSEVPAYRLRALTFQGNVLKNEWPIDQETRPWFLAVAPKEPGSPDPPAAQDLVAGYAMEPVVSQPDLSIYVARPPEAKPK